MTSIHAFIRHKRRALGLDQQQFADVLGVSQSAVRAWERTDGLLPTRAEQRRVAGVLNVSMAEFLSVLALTQARKCHYIEAGRRPRG